MSDIDVLIALCTAPDTDAAASLARRLVRERAAACVNVVPGVRSVYRWQGEIHDDGEALLIIKTDRRRISAVADVVDRHHPYDCPELVAVAVEDGLPAYLEWVVGSLDDPG